jgi:hypothetical protein
MVKLFVVLGQVKQTCSGDRVQGTNRSRVIIVVLYRSLRFPTIDMRHLRQRCSDREVHGFPLVYSVFSAPHHSESVREMVFATISPGAVIVVLSRAVVSHSVARQVVFCREESQRKRFALTSNGDGALLSREVCREPLVSSRLCRSRTCCGSAN